MTPAEFKAWAEERARESADKLLTVNVDSTFAEAVEYAAGLIVPTLLAAHDKGLDRAWLETKPYQSKGFVHDLNDADAIAIGIRSLRLTEEKKP